ncbi:MAG: hypothetical protein QF467_00925 [SAR202 cluster bacterium]|jgi:hypothetical protein|nr:hypothetical protein [SAR202 cluster bacterium]
MPQIGSMRQALTGSCRPAVGFQFGVRAIEELARRDLPDITLLPGVGFDGLCTQSPP